MKVFTSFYILLFCLSANVTARTCFEFELIGEIKVAAQTPQLVLAEGTLSHVSLKLSLDEILTFAPFIDRTVKIKIITNLSQIHANSQVLKIEEIDHAVFDPLNQTAETRKLIKEVKCP